MFGAAPRVTCQGALWRLGIRQRMHGGIGPVASMGPHLPPHPNLLALPSPPPPNSPISLPASPSPLFPGKSIVLARTRCSTNHPSQNWKGVTTGVGARGWGCVRIQCDSCTIRLHRYDVIPARSLRVTARFLRVVSFMHMIPACVKSLYAYDPCIHTIPACRSPLVMPRIP